MGKPRGTVQFSQLVDMASPAAVLEEVKSIYIESYPVAGFQPLRSAFADFLRLYAGDYPGYHACNTNYHDKTHVTDALMAMARLVGGYNASGPKLPERWARLGLAAAIFHDAGFIKRKSDKKGTGAKYTLTHVGRSVGFVREYFRAKGLPAADARAIGRMILCTELSQPLDKIKFSCPQERLAALMLGAADLLGQMASRSYLERLRVLYREFREGRVKGYSSELELLRKTVDFAGYTANRLAGPLEGVDRHIRAHFRRRYGLNRDFYREAMEHHLAYLKEKVLAHPDHYKDFLRRAM